MGANISRWRPADKNNPPIKDGIAVISQLTRLKGSMKEKFTANQIIDALREKHGNLSAAARFLGGEWQEFIAPHNLGRWMGIGVMWRR